MKAVVTPTYKDFFGPTKTTPEELLFNIPITILIGVVGVLNAELYLSQDAPSAQSNILKFLLRRQSPHLVEGVYGVMKQVGKKSEAPVEIFSKHLNLAFLHFALIHHKNLPLKDTTPQQEFNIFRAYLLISEREYSNVKFTHEPDILPRYRKNTWPMLAGQIQLNQFNNYIIDMVKAKCWFDFLEFKSDFGEYVNSFLNQVGSYISWHYILNLASQLTNAWSSYSSGNLAPAYIRAEEPYNRIYEKINLDPLQYKRDYSENRSNYNGLRDRPVYEFDKKSYLVIDWNIFSGKIFQGLLFDFYKHSGIDTEFNSLIDFKNFIGWKSTEGYLFRKLIESIFHRKHDVILFDNQTGHGIPDAYVRIGSKVLLFELKDAFSASTAIESNDYQIIKDSIDGKFNTHKKGTGQLLKHIVALKDSGFEKQKIKTRNLTIYPILLYTDDFYGLPGVSLYLQEEFLKKLEGRALLNSFKSIKRLAFFNINFLIQHLHELKKDRTVLTKIIDSSFKKLNGRQKHYSKHPTADNLHKWNEDFYRLMNLSLDQVKTNDDNFLKAVFDDLDLKQGL